MTTMSMLKTEQKFPKIQNSNYFTIVLRTLVETLNRSIVHEFGEVNRVCIFTGDAV